MKKFSLILILMFSLLLAVGCHTHTYSSNWENDLDNHWHSSSCHDGEKTDVGSHIWVSSGSDNNGNAVYVCAVCGFTHEHVYNAQKWEFNGREHWHPVSCGHIDAPLFTEDHTFDDDTGICSVCGCDQNQAKGYEVKFSYYVVDENGNPVLDSSGYYIQIGVTYTSVEEKGSLPIDTINGGTLFEGDKVSFTVQKSVFCYYTDGADSPLVEVISDGIEEGKNIRETIYPDENGVYTVDVKGNTIISVANVQTSERTITGNGTKETPFIINSEVDWLYFAMYINDKDYYSLDYNIAYWELNADLDFEGETIYVIGDGYSSQSSVFCGNFNGNGHTISNFVLENSVSASVGEGYSNYLGLFGVVTGYVGVDSVIANLNVENVTVNAVAADNDIVSAGVILGYGGGANVVNCSVKNSVINVSADDTYMSYAGGIVGFLQSGMTEEGILFYSSISYSVTEDLTIKGAGMLYNAGGIAGRLVSYNDQVTSFVLNCYSSGSISDASRSGGIVGELQRYSSIQNCYSTANVSAHATYKAVVEEKFDATVYDDRYSYAGGIAGFADNDTVVEGCFFDGKTYATALAGKNFGKTSSILAGYSKDKFADYNAKQVVLNNQAEGDVIDNNYIKNQLNWSEADWVFANGYPTINKNEVSHNFTVTINIDGVNEYSLEVNSQYIPLSYWYVIDGSNSTYKGIARNYQKGTNRTYGYYFDSELTKPVPVGYVPMRDITLYAKYANTSSIAGDYYISNNGVAVDLSIATDGTYYYKEGAIYLKGIYQFDGEVVTFYNSFFSRISSDATSAQKAYYYTFWAKLQPNGDLHLYDCNKKYVVPAENEAQNPTFTSMARFYEETNPLVIISANNLSFTGGYYYNDGNVKHVFEFNSDYTGVYKKYVDSALTQDTFTFYADNSKLVISLDGNGTQFIATSQNGSLVLIEDNRGDEFAFLQIDEFAGTWEKKATSHKVYTFDGMGNWTYEHYVYLVSENVVNATKQLVNKDSGNYVIVNGELNLTRQENGNINVVATNKNGVIYVTENGLPVQVEFTGKNSYKGVWYTANNKIVRYTLSLNGLNSNNVGTATLSGFKIAPLELHYTVDASGRVYLYLEDVVYAVLEYSTKTGLFEGLFYDNYTGATTTPQTLYLYDDFYGSWVSDIEGMESIKFNGFGGYNTKDESGNTLAVKGVVTIGNKTANYVIDRLTGNAEFTLNQVKYVLSYNEYTNSITVKYNGNEGVIAKADSYVNVALKNDQTYVKFDGRGYFTDGGAVSVNGETGVYKIQANGDILIKINGKADQTIVVKKDNGNIIGYSIGGNDLFVDSVFTGVWAIPEKNLTFEVGNIAYIPSANQTIKIDGKFNGTSVIMYYNGTDTITFEYEGKKYSLVNTLGGNIPALILNETVTVGAEQTTQTIVVEKDDFFGVWKKDDKDRNVLTFDGCGGSDYVLSGRVNDKQGNTTYKRTYKIVNGVVTIYDATTNKVYATFVECEKNNEGEYVNTDGAYVNNGRYYQYLLA